MPSPSTIFGAIALIIVILVGGAVALLYLYPGLTHKITTSSSTTTSTTTRSTTTTSTTSTTTSSSTCTASCTLQLIQAGGGPALNSPLTTSMGPTNFTGDGPCCSSPPVYANEINYTDNGNLWTLQGDLNPMGGAWAVANSSGLTLNYKSCPNTGNLTHCGPHSERYKDKEAYDDSSIYADLGGIPVCPPSGCSVPRHGGESLSFGSKKGFSDSSTISSLPSNATLFSIVVDIPYHSYYPSCSQDTNTSPSFPGCSYEGFSPYDSATFGFDVGGNYDVVSVAEICPCTSTSNTLLMSAYTSAGGASIVQMLNSTTVSNFTSTHKLTIATDRKTFIDMYVDNNLLYSSSTLPIPQNPSGGSGVLEFAMRTSINNETSVVTFSNVTVLASSTISASGLSSGMSLVVHGPNGFVASGNANSSGVATVEVGAEPTNLTVSIELNGNTVASYSSAVNAGSEFKLTS